MSEIKLKERLRWSCKRWRVYHLHRYSKEPIRNQRVTEQAFPSYIDRWSSLTVILQRISKNNLLNNINRQTDPGKSRHQQTGKCAIPYDKSLPTPWLASIWHLCSSHFSNLSFALQMYITSWVAAKFLPSFSTLIPSPGPIKHFLLLL